MLHSAPLAFIALVLFQLVPSHGGAAPPSAPAAPAATSAAGIAWTVPKGWISGPSSSAMRFATYRVAAAPGDKEGGEISVFVFGKGDGGSVDGNVARWQAQFQPEGKGAPLPPSPKATKEGPFTVTLVTAEGTFSSGMPGGDSVPKAGWALRGAIVEGPGGQVFFKLVGPKKTVQKETLDFDRLVKSLRKG